MTTLPSIDLSIGRGDNAPGLTWAMPFAVAGSDFRLVVTSPAAVIGQPSTVLVFTVSGGDLTLDTTANAVSWPITSAESQALAPTNFYTLRRIVTGGEIRYYVEGRIFGEDGPVGPASVVVPVAGPQGSPGPAATDAQIAAAVAAYIAANPITPIPPPVGASGVLDFTDPANGGLLAALGMFGSPFVPGSSSATDFSNPSNSGLVAVLGV